MREDAAAVFHRTGPRFEKLASGMPHPRPSTESPAAPVRHYGADLLSRRQVRWGGVTASIMRRERMETVSQRFRLPWPAFRLGLSGTFGRGSVTRLGDGMPAPLVSAPDTATFYPPGIDIANEVSGASRLTYLMVEIDAERDGSGPGPGRLLPILALRDPLCLLLLRRVRDEVERPCASSRLFGETAAAMLLLLAAGEAGPGPAPARRPGGLSPAQLTRVTDRIGDGASGEIPLGELAALVGLSPGHLCRAFKISTGTTPHRGQMAARIARAQDLMRDRALPLAAVAVAAGFADQAHFTTAFRRHTGVTPGAWRRALD